MTRLIYKTVSCRPVTLDLTVAVAEESGWLLVAKRKERHVAEALELELGDGAQDYWMLTFARPAGAADAPACEQIQSGDLKFK